MEQNDWHAIVAKPSRKESMAAAVAELLQRDPSLDAVMDMALGQGADDMIAQLVVLNDLDRSPGMRALLRRVRANHLK